MSEQDLTSAINHGLKSVGIAIQRQQDIANIEYFLSDKVSVEGHSGGIRGKAYGLAEYLYHAMLWDDTPEGFCYWNRICCKLLDIAEDQNILSNPTNGI